MLRHRCRYWLALLLPLLLVPYTMPYSAEIAVPSYFYPGPAWSELENAAPVVGLAVINPSNGPGDVLEQNYSVTTASAQARGIKVLGYVHTNYARRPLTSVKADIDRHFDWYGVNGIFVDEASNECAKSSYYQQLFDYVKSKQNTATVVINPGGVTHECYASAADIILNFEDEFRAYRNWKPMGWEYKYPAQKFWHLVHNTQASDMPEAVRLAQSRNVHWLYVTPDMLPNPWDTLPPMPYWRRELELLSH